jgi:hypothetical protein
MSGSASTGSSERLCVMNYLNGRIIKAWSSGNDEEAADCLRFLEALEETTDAEYESEYSDDYASDIA